MKKFLTILLIAMFLFACFSPGYASEKQKASSYTLTDILDICWH